MPTLDDVLAHCDRQQSQHLTELMPILAQPSVSAQNIGLEECAALVHELLASSGFTAEYLRTTGGAPAVYAERCPAPGQPTLLIYGHYDVQPPDPLGAWVTPPFEPDIRDGRIYARGVGDNKGQFVANILGVRSWIESRGELPVNVKFLIEGEEESGSPHLPQLVAENRQRLSADLVFVADGQVFDDEQPIIEFGNRGLLAFELTARGPARDLHSGNYGGVAPNPAWTLVHLLNTMMNDRYEVTVPGVQDDVRIVDDRLRRTLDALPLDEARVLRDIGLDAPCPPPGVSVADRMMTRMTCNIAGFASGYADQGSKTVLPSVARAKIDMRLVPDQNPEDVFEKVRAHVEQISPQTEIQLLGTMNPVITPLDYPFAAPVRKAVARGFERLGNPPVDFPLDGGSLPSSIWPEILGVHSLLVPYANHDEAHHSPNENLKLERYFAGIRTAAALVGEMSTTHTAELETRSPS